MPICINTLVHQVAARRMLEREQYDHESHELQDEVIHRKPIKYPVTPQTTSHKKNLP